MASPNDSAISVVTASMIPISSSERSSSKNRPGSGSRWSDEKARSKSNSPRSAQAPGYSTLSASEQAALDLENAAAVAQAQVSIIVDSASDNDGASVTDAGYETDSLRSGSTSISSSVRDYMFENGRRYHRFREGAYNFPNDESEQEREDMKHAMMLNLCQTLYFAPLGDSPGNILDLGTGTGAWAIDMGDLYPGANIMGVDLSPIQPEWVPPNVRFMVDDVEDEWLRPRDHYDYIHSRHMVMAIKNWPKLLKQVLDHLKPGGWYEMQEIHHYPQCHDGSMPFDHPVAQFWSYVHEGLGALNVNFSAVLTLEDKMREAGFVNVSVRLFHVPIGTWPKNKVLKTVGLYWREVLLMGVEPIALGPFTRGLKWSREQIEVFLVSVRQGYGDTWCHSHMPLYIICGQRPEG